MSSAVPGSDPHGATPSSAVRTTPPPRRTVLILTASCAVVVVAVVAVILLATGSPSGSGGSPSSNVILATGTYPIAAETLLAEKFQEAGAFTLSGAWTAETSRGTLTMFVLNDSEYATLNATGNPGGYEVLWPNATGTAVLNQVTVPAGNGVFVLYNYSDDTVNVSVTQAVVALS